MKQCKGMVDMSFTNEDANVASLRGGRSRTLQTRGYLQVLLVCFASLAMTRVRISKCERHITPNETLARFIWATCFTLLLTALPCQAARYGVTASLPLYAKEPTPLWGYQVMLDYDPMTLSWKRFSLYFDGGFSRFWSNNYTTHTAINIYSAAPVLRYTLPRYHNTLPFFEMSVGLSYLDRTRLQNRNLGIHMAFQDRLGIGALLGAAEHFSLGIHAVHYSNAHLSSHNSGITVPLELDIGYRF